MSERNKELKKEYKQNHPPMGVYQIRNLVNDKVFIEAALNLPGILNRHQFELKLGKHKNQSLQAEWNEFGAEKFAFEVLDEITATEGVDHDYRPDLIALEDLWLEKLEPYGERGYNKPKKSKEEKLREIAEQRLRRDWAADKEADDIDEEATDKR